MFQRTAFVAFLLLALAAAPVAADDTAQPERLQPRSIDLVICLDTSGSMSGLIHAARQKLWSVVNELAMLKPEPRLRVALLTFGSPGKPGAKPGDVVIQTDLTTDLDLVSEKLFALGTNGGKELVGRVMYHALHDLSWSKDAGLKTLFVAGNESADQDHEKRYTAMAKLAQTRGIHVNAIYCGGADDGDAASWRTLAGLNGRFSNIDHNRGTVNVATPFDKRLAELSGKLNNTYVFFGKERVVRESRQRAQDANAKKAGAPAAAQRAEAKAGAGYAAPGDLVGRLKDAAFDAGELKDEELPEAMRKLSPEERKAYLVKKAEERTKLQAEIKELSAKRAAFVKKAMADQKLDDSRSLDRALRDAVKEQAKAAGFGSK
ncbi:MAG: vWA domain-containing protein [Planctomycetota bacterium]|nr:vWA domain-containing protein [Planctomycetota bacterium]